MISTSFENRTLTMTIDRVSKKNALTQDMYQQMAVALENSESMGASAVLIQGAGGIFTSGNDLSDFLNKAPTDEVNDTYRFMKALMYCPIPVVAKVQSLAVGIGTTLLLHCDFVYADKHTKFAMPFINLGLVPEYASSFILPRVAGYLKASELLLLGEVFGVELALDCGIITYACKGSDLDKKVNETLISLSEKPVEALKASKALIRHQLSPIHAHMDRELKVFARALNSDAAKEAFAAFIEKRPINQSIYK